MLGFFECFFVTGLVTVTEIIDADYCRLWLGLVKTFLSNFISCTAESYFYFMVVISLYDVVLVLMRFKTWFLGLLSFRIYCALTVFLSLLLGLDYGKFRQRPYLLSLASMSKNTFFGESFGLLI